MGLNSLENSIVNNQQLLNESRKINKSAYFPSINKKNVNNIDTNSNLRDGQFISLKNKPKNYNANIGFANFNDNKIICKRYGK